MRTFRSEPSRFARSILAMWPQSVQKRYLRHNIVTETREDGTQRLRECRGHRDIIKRQASSKGPFTRPFFPGSLFCWPETHPFLGKTAMARGSSRLLLTSTLRQEPSSLDASMVFRPVSVQYRFLATQSTASPSVVFRPCPITVSMLLPFRSARLGEEPRVG